MLLAIDVGNTDTKLGFFSAVDGRLALGHTWRVETSRRRTADEFGVLVETLFRVAGRDSKDVRSVAISSVVPQIDLALARGVKTYFDCEAAFFNASVQRLIEVTTERPREVGADLLASAIAAKRR